MNESIDSFKAECNRFDEDYEKEKMLNKEKFKGLILEVPEAYTETDAQLAENQMREDIEKANEKDDDDTVIPSESRISKQLSEEITKVVVSLVLIMLFIAPLFQMDTWVDVQLYHKAAIDMAIKTYNRGLQEFEYT